MENNDPRIEQLFNQILQYTKGDYSVRLTPSKKSDELDAIIIGLNTLGEEIETSGKNIRDYEKRVTGLMDILLKYTLFDFTEKAEVSPVGDELDAIAIGLNTMAEELISARKAEEEYVSNINETNRFLNAVLENIPNMVFVKEAGELRFVRFNKAGEELLGYPRDKMIGHNDYDFFPKEQADFFTSKDREALNKKTVTDIEEEEIQTTSGTKWLHTKKIPIIENGKPAYLLGISEDITERKKTEQALRESEERLRLLIEGVKDYAIFMIDETGHVLNWNQGSESVKGYKAAEIIGKHISVFYTETDLKEGKPEQNLKIARESGHFEDEGWRMRKDGTRFWADVIFTPLYNLEGALKGYSTITRDITEKKEAEEKVKQLNRELAMNVEQLENVNKELEAFTYSVSHDLRAPLRAIHGYTKILEEDYFSKLDEDARAMMDSVMNNAKKMGQLIDDLLALSRLGKKELQTKEVNMTELAKNGLEEILKQYDNLNPEVTIHPLPPAMGDQNLIQQVFINLISNAVKYSSLKEKQLIEIGAKKEKKEVIYYVKDNGTGFDMKYYDKLFGIFQRLHDASEFEGTGVGLALVKRIVTRHNGRVWAESKLGEGATFYFTIGN